MRHFALALLAGAAFSSPTSAATTITISGYFTGSADGDPFNGALDFVGISKAGPEAFPDGTLYRLTSLVARAPGVNLEIKFTETDLFFAEYPAFNLGQLGLLPDQIFFSFAGRSGEPATVDEPSDTKRRFGRSTDAGFLEVLTGENISYRIETTDAPAVPEPATWAMMIGGFGLVGGAMRYRNRSVSLA